MIDKTPALPEPVAYEAFCDASYYDMWCVRPVDERQFGMGFHLVNGDEAKALAQILSDHATKLSAALDLADRSEKELDEAQDIARDALKRSGEAIAVHIDLAAALSRLLPCAPKP